VKLLFFIKMRKSGIKSKINSTEIDGVKISASVGWAHYKSDSADIYKVVEIADKRMYEDKRN
jgi:GGDEF domain-containing protein